jgi:DNA-binding CsgD family transcriptional regulator
LALETRLDVAAAVDPNYVVGSVLAERDELARAVAHLAVAVERSDAIGLGPACVLTRIALAKARHAQGDVDATEALLADARSCVIADSRVLLQRVTDAEVLLALRRGDIDTAERRVFDLAEPCRSRRSARLFAQTGDPARALAALEMAPATSPRNHLDSLFIRAMCTDGPARSAIVSEALVAAEPDGYVRTITDEAPWIRPALTDLVGSWPTDYPSRLLDIIAAEPSPTAAGTGGEHLTEREREVLRYLATQLTMRDIARTLFISRNTLKSHVRSIYQKLGVQSREGAVAWQRRRMSLTAPA